MMIGVLSTDTLVRQHGLRSAETISLRAIYEQLNDFRLRQRTTSDGNCCRQSLKCRSAVIVMATRAREREPIMAVWSFPQDRYDCLHEN